LGAYHDRLSDVKRKSSIFDQKEISFDKCLKGQAVFSPTAALWTLSAAHHLVEFHIWCRALSGLSPVPPNAEIEQLIEDRRLWGRGLGWIDTPPRVSTAVELPALDP
jgi:hypothetical protein